jgi:hypothetical protein
MIIAFTSDYDTEAEGFIATVTTAPTPSPTHVPSHLPSHLPTPEVATLLLAVDATVEDFSGNEVARMIAEIAATTGMIHLKSTSKFQVRKQP